MTSETSPLGDIAQSFVWTDESIPSDRENKHRVYAAAWSQPTWGEWLLQLTVPDQVNLSPTVMIRSVGRPEDRSAVAMEWALPTDQWAMVRLH